MNIQEDLEEQRRNRLPQYILYKYIKRQYDKTDKLMQFYLLIFNATMKVRRKTKLTRRRYIKKKYHRRTLPKQGTH